jgi:hypothetical protein
MTTTPSDPPLLGPIEDDELLEEWAEYLGGKWVLQRPEYPGIYGIMTLEGDFVGYRSLVQQAGKLVDTLAGSCEPGWQGWWWSRRLPRPPKEVPN